MLGRIIDAVVKRVLPAIREAVREEIDARQDLLEKDAREIIGEMNDVLEKFSRVVAREAKRRTREAKDVLEPGGGGSAEPTQAAPGAANIGQSPEQRKAAIWARVRGKGVA